MRQNHLTHLIAYLYHDLNSPIVQLERRKIWIKIDRPALIIIVCYEQYKTHIGLGYCPGQIGLQNRPQSVGNITLCRFGGDSDNQQR